MDRKVEVHKVEKIKTNPYLCVCGCPEKHERIENIRRLVELAADILEEVDLYNSQQEDPDKIIKVKIGIHSGKLQSGVLGVS